MFHFILMENVSMTLLNFIQSRDWKMIVSSRLLKVRSFSFFFSVILILKINGQHRVRTEFLSPFSTRRICSHEQTKNFLLVHGEFFRQPILANHVAGFLFSLRVARTNSPSGKRALITKKALKFECSKTMYLIFVQNLSWGRLFEARLI